MTKKLIFLVVILSLFIPSMVNAIDVPNRGISLSPGSFEEWMGAGEKKEETLFISNNTGKLANFIIEIEDFEASADPKISNQLLGQNKSSYSLKDYLKPEFNEISIENGKTIPMKVSISIPAGITSPGLYGAVLVKQKNEGNPEESTSITPRVGVLFYVGIKGNFPRGAESIDLKYIPFEEVCKEDGCSPNQEEYDKFSVSFQNGNKVHLSLTGDIEIKNILGKTVDSVKVNPWYVMADSLKLKEVKWKSPEYLFGFYKATAKLVDYNSREVKEKTIYFWVLPWQIIVAIIVLSILVFLLLKLVSSKFKGKKLSEHKEKSHSKIKVKK